jgi:O-antigen/teichoic acid export membrane protein
LSAALSFSRDVAMTRLAWYFYSRADFLVAGRFLGQNLTGLYSMAWTLANIPVDKISSLVSKVTPAFFSAVQTDPAATRRYFILLAQGLSLITFPIAVGVAITASDFVHVVLTDKWSGAIRPLQVLSLYAAFASLTAILTPILAAARKQRFTMYTNLTAAVLLPAGFLVGSRWGTAGIAFAWLILHPPIVVLLLHRVVESTSVRWHDVGAAIWPALSSVIVMAGVVSLLHHAFLSQSPVTLRLLMEVSAAVVTYGLTLATGHPTALQRLKTAAAILRSSPSHNVLG